MPDNFFDKANRAYATTDSTVTNIALTFDVTTVTGYNALPAGLHTIQVGDDTQGYEIMTATRAGATLTVTRAQEGTGALPFLAATDVKLVISAAQIVELEDAINTRVEQPASSTDNAIARFDGVDGDLVQNSQCTCDDNGALKVDGNSNSVIAFEGESGHANNYCAWSLGRAAAEFQGAINHQANSWFNPSSVGDGIIKVLDNTKTLLLGVGAGTAQMLIDNTLIATNVCMLVGGTVLQDANSDLEVQGSYGRFCLFRDTNDDSGPTTHFHKSDNDGIVTDDAVLGTLYFTGHDGGDYATQGAQIRAIINGAPAANRMPTDIEFYTALGGADNDAALAMTIHKEKDVSIVGALTLGLGAANQDYLFTNRSTSQLVIQAQAAGITTGVELYTKDTDGTDTLAFVIYGDTAGAGPADITDRERLILRWPAGGSQYQMYTEKAGTGTLRPLAIYTDGNADQLLLAVDGSVSTVGDFTVGDDLTVTGNDISDSGGVAVTFDGSQNTTLAGNLTITNTKTILRGVSIISKAFTFDGGNETIVACADGYVVVDAYVEITTTFDGDGVVTVGDAGDNAGFLTDAGIVQGAAAYYGQDISARGAYIANGDRKIYTGATNVIVYVTQGTSTQGAGTAYVVIQRLK